MSFEFVMGMAAGSLIGGAFLVFGFYQRSRVRASQSWPQTMATITKAEIVEEKDRDSRGYVVNVLYGYTVDGVSYTGQRIGFGKRQYIRKKRAQAELQRYPVNSSVLVYFDPRKPADAVLVREYPDNLILVMGGIILLAIVVAGLWNAGR